MPKWRLTFYFKTIPGDHQVQFNRGVLGSIPPCRDRYKDRSTCGGAVGRRANRTGRGGAPASTASVDEQSQRRPRSSVFLSPPHRTTRQPRRGGEGSRDTHVMHPSPLRPSVRFSSAHSTAVCPCVPPSSLATTRRVYDDGMRLPRGRDRHPVGAAEFWTSMAVASFAVQSRLCFCHAPPRPVADRVELTMRPDAPGAP